MSAGCTAALVMPKNYVIINEDEMMYLEGGIATLYASANEIKKRCTTLGAYCRSCALAGLGVGAALTETVLGAVLAGATASMFWSWADSFSNCKAKTESIIASSKKRGNQRVKYTEKLSGLTLVLNVSKA